MSDEQPCFHCHTLTVRDEKMARRVERARAIQHDEVALQRLAYAALVRSITNHFQETGHVVDFERSMTAVLARPFCP